MMVDLLPETMRFVSIGDDGRLELEFVFEVTSGLTRFTLPVRVGGAASIDQALAEATEKVRSLGVALAQAAHAACWSEALGDPDASAGRAIAARPAAPAAGTPFRIERANGAIMLTDSAIAAPQCCDAISDMA